jgi:membrane fusion protein, multidrug efflux system
VSQQIGRTVAGVRVVALAVGAVVFAGGCRRGNQGFGGFPPSEVAIVTVSPSAVPESFEFPGEVAPYRRVEVRSRVEGVIQQRPFTEGAMVKPGELLYRLDKVRY